MKTVLSIDIEGGHGGSSHSLYELLCALKERVSITCIVWCRLSSKLLDGYTRSGIQVEIKKSIPRATSSKSNFINIKLFFLLPLRILIAYDFWISLISIRRHVDLVHLNHESLWIVSLFLKHFLGKRVIMHIRTNRYSNWFARLQSWSIDKSCDRLIFISEFEQINFNKTYSNANKYKQVVMYNPISKKILECRIGNQSTKKKLDHKKTVKIICIGNYSPLRGIDRLLEVAQELRKLPTERAYEFIWIGDFGRINSRLLTELRANVTCKGFIVDVLGELIEADLLVKFNRDSNPWGRDIIDASTVGLPIFAIGSNSPFISHGYNGLLLEKYSVEETARILLSLIKDPVMLDKMGQNGRKLILEKCAREKIALQFKSLITDITASVAR